MITQPVDAALLGTIYPFSLLSEDELKRSALFFEKIIFLAGSTIISYGYPAKELFFILSGSVQLSLATKDKDRDLGILTAGDHFGDDVLLGNSQSQYRAICLSEVTVLKIRRSKAFSMADSYAVIANYFSLLERSSQISQKQNISWLSANENIVLISRNHSLFLILKLITCGALTVLFSSFLLFSALAADKNHVLFFILATATLIVGAIFGIWLLINWRNDYLIITKDRVCRQKKITGFYETRYESPLDAIMAVSVDTSFWGRILGFGTIVVKTYTGDLFFKRLPYPNLITSMLEEFRRRATKAKKSEGRQEIRNVLTGQSFSSDNAVSQGHEKKLNTSLNLDYDKRGITGVLSRFFHLRVETEDAVVFRTHWWILIRKTFAPSLFLVGLLFLTILRFLDFMAAIPQEAFYVIAAILCLPGCGWWLYQLQDWKNDTYLITDDMIIDVNRKPLGNEDRRTAPIKNIQTVEFERKGLLKLILDFGTVKIKVGNEELSFDNVFHPSAVQSEIYARYKLNQEKSRQGEQQRFVEWIKMYDEIKKENEDPFRGYEEEEKE